jgi:hypothetical protein
MARGGEILCPGPRELAIQYVRDTPAWDLLEACHAVSGADDAILSWLDPEAIAAAADLPRPGLDAERERDALTAWHHLKP